MYNILIINCGSTSTKYTLFSKDGEVLKKENFKIEEKVLEEKFLNNISNIKIKKIAFRVVHGGDLKGPIKIDEKVIEKIKYFLDFAPIHNAIFLNKLENIKKIFKNNVKFFAVFDTDFHQTIAIENSLYAIDRKISEKYKIKKYGFHGLAVESAILNFKDLCYKNGDSVPEKILVAHLGGGASLTAVIDNKSIANTMELTPVSGLVMTTRVGEVDSDLDKILAKKMKKDIEEISHLLNFESGLYGLAGTKDIKYIFDKAEIEFLKKTGEFENEKIAFLIYFEKLIEKIFAFIGKMNGVDKIIFSGGTGYGNSFLRKRVAERLKIFNIAEKDFFITKIDEEKVIFNKVVDL